jgi:predicted ester cyclase
MSNAQNRNMGKKRRKGNTTPQKPNNHTIKDLVESEGDKSSVAAFRKMMIRMFNELKEEHKEEKQKQLNES